MILRWSFVFDIGEGFELWLLFCGCCYVEVGYELSLCALEL